VHRWERRVEWPLAGAAAIFLAVYSVQVLADPQGRVKDALEIVLGVTYVLFVIDYLVRLTLADNRLHWFFRHLIDLAIVALPFLRPLRLLRLLVLFSALQKAVGGATRGRVIVYTAFSVALLIYVASLAMLEAERDVSESVIDNFGDAVWWSIATVTTVGYGDLSPVTTVGRVVAVFLMIGGISLVGVVTATLASWVIERVSDEGSAHAEVTATQIDDLRLDMQHRIDALTAELQRLNGGGGSPSAARPRGDDS
jgi:voltage-gated potassium channel